MYRNFSVTPGHGPCYPMYTDRGLLTIGHIWFLCRFSLLQNTEIIQRQLLNVLSLPSATNAINVLYIFPILAKVQMVPNHLNFYVSNIQCYREKAASV